STSTVCSKGRAVMTEARPGPAPEQAANYLWPTPTHRVMRLLLQRVSRAEVRVGERVTGRVARGYLLLVGFTHEDREEQLVWMAEKVVGLRLFADAEDKMNLSLADVGGGLLVVSQFTLYGDAAKGRRPSFIDAARPDRANALYQRLCDDFRRRGLRVATGVFGADMRV